MSKNSKKRKGPIVDVPIKLYNPKVTEPNWIPVIQVNEAGEAPISVDIHWPDDDRCDYEGDLAYEDPVLPDFYRITDKAEKGELKLHPFSIPDFDAYKAGELITVFIVSAAKHSAVFPIYKA